MSRSHQDTQGPSSGGGRSSEVLPRPALAERLPVLQAALERPRDIRREQLAQLEVQALVVLGARRALDDIELAPARIRTDGYGRCRACGAGITMAVIEAVPQTRCARVAIGGETTPEVEVRDAHVEVPALIRA